MLFYGLVLALAGTTMLLDLPDPQGALTLSAAQFQTVSDLDQTPDERRWQPVPLPHAAIIPGVGRFWGGVYRFTFDRPTTSDEPWSVLILSSAGRLLVRVNGALLADSRQLHTAAAVTLSWPKIIPIPAPLLTEGTNQVEIREEARIGRTSYLGPIHVGPDRQLRPVFRCYHLLLVTIPTLMVGWEFAFALSLLLVWLVRPGERAYLLFSLILLLATANGLPFVAAGSLELEGVILTVSSTSFTWQVALMLVFAFLFVGRRPPPWVCALLALPLIHTVLFFVAPADLFRQCSWMVVLPAVIMISLTAAWVFLDAAFRQGNSSAHVVSGGLLLALCLTLHDIPILYGVLDGDHVFLSRFGMPGVLTVISGALMWRFAATLTTVDRFNLELHRRVAVAEAALRHSLEREREQERTVARVAERSRLTRDLHDGLADQLVSMVALSSRTEVDPGAFGSAARRALGDLRMVLASLADMGDDPGMMLANFRDQMEPQLRGLGVTLDWHMSVLPEVSGWTSSTVLELFRLLQEATLNAARHSGTDRVRIDITPLGNEGVRVVVADQGRGGAADRPGGYGLANMRRRADLIGGRLGIESDTSGTRVVLDVPRHPR